MKRERERERGKEKNIMYKDVILCTCICVWDKCSREEKCVCKVKYVSICKDVFFYFHFHFHITRSVGGGRVSWGGGRGKSCVLWELGEKWMMREA